jgi:hypothetical protein
MHIRTACSQTHVSEEIHAVNPIRFKKRPTRSWLDYRFHSEWSRWETGQGGQSGTVVDMTTARREIPTPRRTLDASPEADAVALTGC